MDPTVAGALIGFGGAAVVSVTTQYIAGHSQARLLREQLRHDRAVGDIAQLRALLDEAATLMQELRLRLDQMAQTDRPAGYRPPGAVLDE